MLPKISEFERLMAYQSYVSGEDEWDIDNLLAVCDDYDPTGDWESLRLELPPKEYGKYTVKNIVIDREGRGRILYLLEQGIKRDPGWGVVTTQLLEGDVMWMSDTKAEVLEHLPVFDALKSLNAERVLINGAGLGVLTRFCVNLSHVKRIDVVEIDEDILAIHEEHHRSPKVHLHHEDAFEAEVDGEWDVVWHDIWPEISEDNLPEMATLEDMYDGRCKWQHSWQKEGCQELKRVGDEFADALERQDWARVKEIDPDF